jgi:MMP alpha-(1->4)-mannosyltransferase
VPFGDPDALAGALTRLLGDERLRSGLAQSGRDRVLSLASPAAAAAAYQGIYARALASAGRRWGR